MIVAQLILLGAGLCHGAATRLLYILITKLEKSIALKPITIILDILIAGTSITAFVLMQFVLNNGTLTPFVLLASATGYAGAALIA